MLKPKQETRRALLRRIGLLPAEAAEPVMEAKQPMECADVAKDASGVSRKHRELSKRQFGLRSLFYLAFFVAVLLAGFREEIARRPLVLLGIFVFAVLSALIQEGCLRLFDACLWKVFGEGDRNDH